MIRKVVAAAILIGFSSGLAVAETTWRSGVGGRASTGFDTWRGSALGVATGWAPVTNWNDMLSYVSGAMPRILRSRSTNVSIGVGLFPNNGGNLADCAANRYAENHRSIGSRLTANGVGDAEIRLGWEANNRSWVWTAVGKSAEQWKACFTNAARAIKAGGPKLRIAWHMAKKGKIDVRTIWPDQAASLITNIGVSHYDDAEARFGMETAYGGSPWGLRAWLAYIKGKGKRLEMAEWGVGRDGDDPNYISNMYDFFREAGSTIAHEAYLNGNGHELYAPTKWPNASARYRSLF